MKILETAWREYEAKIVPASAGPVQRVETRQAFYAGAQSLFSGITKGLSDGDEATPEDLSMMDSLAAELRAFGEEIRRGIN